jgi:hypothetical protein
MAASVFVSDEHALDTSIGVAELRLANLVRDGWLAAASHVAYQGGIDQLVRAGPLVTCRARLVWCGFSSWIRYTAMAR